MILEGCYQAKLNDHVITIRPMLVPKKHAEQLLLASGKAQHYRFFSHSENLYTLSHQTASLPDKSGSRRLSFIASGLICEREQVIGICHLDLLPESQACELSISLSAAWLNQGAARVLCQKALEFAHERGVRALFYYDIPSTHQLGLELGLIPVTADTHSLKGIARALMPKIAAVKPAKNNIATLLVSTLRPSLPQAL